MGTVLTVPTSVVGPDGLTYILPGHAAWTNTLTYPTGSPYAGAVQTRDCSDILRYWIRTAVPNGASNVDPTIVKFRSGADIYYCEYGLQLGTLIQTVDRTAWRSLSTGALNHVQWPTEATTVKTYVKFTSTDTTNPALIAQGNDTTDTTKEPRRQFGVQLINITGGNWGVTFEDIDLQMGNTARHDSAFTDHEPWHMVQIRTATNTTFRRCGMNGAWGDLVNTGALPVNTLVEDCNMTGAGRHAFTLQGQLGFTVRGTAAGRMIVDGVQHWDYDNEPLGAQTMLDVVFDNVDWRSPVGHGHCHIKPTTSGTTRAPALLNGCNGNTGGNVLTLSSHSAEYPINGHTINKRSNSTLLFSGPVTTENLGQIVQGTGIVPGSYISRINSGTSVTLTAPTGATAPITAPISNQQLVLGQTSIMRGFHERNCRSNRPMEVWFDGIGSSPGDVWFRANVTGNTNGTSTLSAIYFPPRPDGSTVAFLDVPPSRVFCVYNDVFSGHRINLTSADVFANTYTVGEKSVVNMTGCWFYADTVQAWFSNFSIENNTSSANWGGHHDGGSANNAPCIQYAHHMADVLITGNTQPVTLGGGADPYKDIVVGTLNQKDYANTRGEFTAGFSAHPRDANLPRSATAAEIGPPWHTPYTASNEHGTSGWTVNTNQFLNAIDNQTTTTVTPWLSYLEPSGSGVSPKNTRDCSTGTNPQFNVDPSFAMTVTAHIDSGAPGSITFTFNSLSHGGLTYTAPIASGVATLTVPANTLVGDIWNLTASYPGTVGFASVTYKSNASGSACTLAQLWVSSPATPNTTTLALTSTPSSPTDTQAVVFTATVSGFAAPITDTTISLTGAGVNSPASGTPNNTTGVWTHSQVFPVGTYTVTAHFDGNAGNLGSDSSPVTFTVTATPTQQWVLGASAFG